jgi:PAS domain S-box-containing protein
MSTAVNPAFDLYSVALMPLASEPMTGEVVRESSQRRTAEDVLPLAVAGLRDFAFVTLDPDGVITSWNIGAEALFGWRREETLHLHVSSVLGPGEPDAGIGLEDLQEAMRQGSVSATRRLNHQDGSIRHATTTIQAVRNETGVIGYAVMAHRLPIATLADGPPTAQRDTTSADAGRQLCEPRALLAAEIADRSHTAWDAPDLIGVRTRLRELQRAVGARDEFIATVAHELRNPITPLTFQVRLALNKTEQLAATSTPVSVEWIQTQLRGIERRLHRVLETLDRLLDVSRLSTGRIDLQGEPMNLAAVVREVIDAFEGELAVARCTLTLSERGTATGVWDRLRVEQVCRNLLSNAIRFGAGRPIDITVDADHDFATLTVRDHGIGIAADQQSKIFERFEQGVERRSGGFGIGLWIVRNICVAMGGTVFVESAVGDGACFTVRLPRGLDRGAVESTPSHMR